MKLQTRDGRQRAALYLAEKIQSVGECDLRDLLPGSKVKL